MNTGVHGRSATSATRRLRMTTSVGRISLATSQAHSPSRRGSRVSRGSNRAMAAAALRAASERQHPPRPTPPRTRSTARRGGQAPSPGGRRARERAAPATLSSASGPVPSPSPRPRRRCASDHRRSSRTHHQRARVAALTMGDDDLDLLHIAHHRAQPVIPGVWLLRVFTRRRPNGSPVHVGPGTAAVRGGPGSGSDSRSPSAAGPVLELPVLLGIENLLAPGFSG